MQFVVFFYTNIFVIPTVGCAFIQLFIYLFVVLQLSPLLLRFSYWSLFGSFPTIFPSLFSILYSPRRLPCEFSYLQFETTGNA